VPRGLIVADRPGIGGQPFNIMERVQGHTLGQEIFAPGADPKFEISRLAHIQARLHTIPVAPVQEAVAASGVPLSGTTSGISSIRLENTSDNPA
jgi:aminoglycoside phosphotransferase (APT) family kinase protein